MKHPTPNRRTVSRALQSNIVKKTKQLLHAASYPPRRDPPRREKAAHERETRNCVTPGRSQAGEDAHGVPSLGRILYRDLNQLGRGVQVLMLRSAVAKTVDREGGRVRSKTCIRSVSVSVYRKRNVYSRTMLTVAQLKFLTFSGAGHEPVERVTMGPIGCGNYGGDGFWLFQVCDDHGG